MGRNNVGEREQGIGGGKERGRRRESKRGEEVYVGASYRIKNAQYGCISFLLCPQEER